VFKSFFLAGFECATGYNRHGEWIDQIAATQHDGQIREDYRLLHDAGIYAVRESIRWPLVDRRGRYNFGSVLPALEAANETGIDVIWDLFHYGYPEEVDLFSNHFPQRFADYCYAAARFVSRHTDGPCYLTPINEPSYFSWAAGHAGLFAPHQTDRGAELKVALIRAAIQGINAIWDACPGAKIIQADPVCRVVAPPDQPELQPRADDFNNRVVWESLDMLSGRLRPELGGSPEHLGVVGINYYWTNQWEIDRPEAPLEDDDPRRAPLRDLVRAAWQRYGRDVMITETSHRDDMRPVWLREVAGECRALLDEGVPLRGVCLYPILGMPEWHCQDEWSRMGLWDLDHQAPDLDRVPCEPMMAAFRKAQRLERHPAWRVGTPAVGGVRAGP
jgi:beta-glucosidase/6-phospho-beta-glucosidase/beta-galactosidase